MWRVTPRTIPGNTPKVATLDEIIQILEAAYAAKTARCYLSSGGRLLDESKGDVLNEKNQIYIAEIKRDKANNTVTLLVNRGDPFAAAPAFIDPADKSVEIVHPKENQTPGWSSHLVISLKAEPKGHRACFEKMSHVSSHLVLLAIDEIVSRMVSADPEYTYEKKTTKGRGKGKKETVELKHYRPALTTDRVPSEKLQQDLEDGELNGVTLTKSTISYSGPGAKELVTQQEEKIILRTKAADKTVAAAFVRGVANHFKKQGYTGITFHLDKLPGGLTNNPTIPLDDHDALEQLYVRAQILNGFDELLEACYPQICAAIEKQMIDKVINAHEWPS
jgi:hypothetical protein